MATARPVKCSENEGLASYFLSKWQGLADCNGVSDNIDLTLSIAYRNIADCKTPIRNIKDLSRIKGVGQWILRLMQEFFPKDTDKVQTEGRKGKKTKGPKRYVPQKNSVAYALLITLYKEMLNGKRFMRKQELIDAADGSGLSRTSIAPEKGIGKPGQFGSSPKDWYTGWSCMKGLIGKGLVAKSSCPAKYMLTDEGEEVAQECITRSGMVDPRVLMSRTNESTSRVCADDVDNAFSQRSETSTSSSQPTGYLLEHSRQNAKNDHPASSEFVECLKEDFTVKSPASISSSLDSDPRPHFLQSCMPLDHLAATPSLDVDDLDGGSRSIAMPPREYEEKFEDIYDVILILDDRENFGISCRKVVENIKCQFEIQVEMRRLPIGDGIWLAQHRHMGIEYVLDFIVERKRVDDLRLSIKDNRYRDQKLRLVRCGIQKLIYLVEGDPNACEAAESIKTACFTTEILEGFDVQRTSGLAETVKKYGYLSQAISQFYRTQFSNRKNYKTCPTYEEFIKRCQDLGKMTISDVFGLQLMQVPQVTEEAALAVLQFYPTLLSLVQAYSLLDGDIRAQEEMLKNKSSLINSGASRNIFRLVWS